MTTWSCPYCLAHQVVSEHSRHATNSIYSIGDNDLGSIGLASVAIACANASCRKVTVNAWIAPTFRDGPGNVRVGQMRNAIVSARLMPETSATPQPDYIPKALIEDYYEASKIVDLSPKASATLSRRCLQGMIRDFCGINKQTLFHEISELRKRLDEGEAPEGVLSESVEAIDHVRAIGNIGAHMERDISVIVPVDAGEAQLLIELVESLFEEWYGARERRRVRFERIKAAAGEKKAIVEEARGRSLPPPEPDCD